MCVPNVRNKGQSAAPDQLQQNCHFLTLVYIVNTVSLFDIGRLESEQDITCIKVSN